METEKTDKWIGVRKLQRIGNSLGLTIPSEAIRELDLCEKDRMILVLDREKKAIVLLPAKERTAKLNGHDKELSFHLRVPQELLEKLMNSK